MDWITSINSTIILLFCAMSMYQYIYILVSVLFPARRYKAKKFHRYAVLICARNEETVIGQLIESVKLQNYPADLLDVYVLADNCTDRTREVAEEAGAFTYERHNNELIGKGYALDCLLGHIREDRGAEYYDAYIVLDADNLISRDYVKNMNSVFDNGYRVVTSYRNSKNFGTNWITAGYGLMFMREARHMNNARMILHTSSAISGTGFMVHRDIINEKGGWPYHLLTEDLEFTMERIADGETIGYCHDAVFYDEQPTTFGQSWRQRLRWSKGFFQAFFKHGGKMMAGIFKRKSGFSCFDETVSTMPSILLSVFATISLGSMIYGAIYEAVTLQNGMPWHYVVSFFGYLFSIYGVNFLLGLLTTITEWKKITCSPIKKILYTFTYPIFMMSNIPISIAAIFARVKWDPIAHGDSTGIKELEKC